MHLSNNEFFSGLSIMYLIKMSEKLSHLVFIEFFLKKGLRNKRQKERKREEGREGLLGEKCIYFFHFEEEEGATHRYHNR